MVAAAVCARCGSRHDSVRRQLLQPPPRCMRSILATVVLAGTVSSCSAPQVPGDPLVQVTRPLPRFATAVIEFAEPHSQEAPTWTSEIPAAVRADDRGTGRTVEGMALALRS